MTSDVKTSNIFLRNDTIFGTCEAIGEDFGFNANWLRIPLAASVVFNPFAVVGAYLALSLLVMVSRGLFQPKTVSQDQETLTTAEAPAQANDQAEQRIAA